MKGRILEAANLIFFIFFLGSVAWRINVNNSPIEALVGEDITIPCLLSDIPIPLNLRVVMVTWTLKLKIGVHHEVYHFISFKHNASRLGSYMANSDLEQGNASLYIPVTEISDDGEYICSVRVSPDLVSATSSVHISVKPQVTLTDSVSVEFGYERVILCDVTKFYPEPVMIQWVKHSKSTGTNSSLDGDTYGTPAAQNSDGTFNATSLLTIKPSSKDEDGDRYSCVVKHRSLKEKTVVTSTLVIKGNGFSTIKDLILVIGGFCLALVLLGIAYWLYFIQGEPTLFWIPEDKKDERIFHKEKTTFTCLVRGWRRKKRQINVYLKRFGNAENQLIHSWEFTDPPSSSNYTPAPLRRRQNYHAVNKHVIMPMHENHSDFPVEMKTLLISEMGICYCHCSICITPNAKTDNGAELIVEVKSAVQKKAVCVQRTLEVIKVDPEITMAQPVEDGDSVKIVCCVKWAHHTKFAITWSQSQAKSGVFEKLAFYNFKEYIGYDPTKGIQHDIEEDDDQNSFSSVLTFNKHLDGWKEKQFNCLIQHLETGYWEMKSTSSQHSPPSPPIQL